MHLILSMKEVENFTCSHLCFFSSFVRKVLYSLKTLKPVENRRTLWTQYVRKSTDGGEIHSYGMKACTVSEHTGVCHEGDFWSSPHILEAGFEVNDEYERNSKTCCNIILYIV